MNFNKTGDNIKADISSWSFSGNTASEFDKHIGKSVPGYEQGQLLIASYCDFFINLTPKKIYDLGCSTGSLLEKIEARHPMKEISFIGIDLVPEMIEKSKKKQFLNPINFQFLCEDISTFEFDEASIICSYYTLQFVLPSVRQKLVNKIYDSLTWGGAFFVFEKTRGPDGRFQDMNTHVYNEYKINKGYSPEEIFNKSRSLAGVLEPFSDRGNFEMFERAGFKDIECIFTNINFKGWICIK